ncbi:MAG TPA: ATP-binding protein, partial [Gammaproteobacteria bacterium]|nr:ATP-binding protein [Gammaproteobacteria bacterium]
MSEHTAQLDPLAEAAIATRGNLSPGDLAELMSAFTEVTTKLERTHEQLRSEVSRLNAELRDANEALQRSRRLAALGEMAAGISHEIRNPLGSIQLYTSMLSEDLAQMPEQHEIVAKIGRAVRGLDEIVGDVLSFAREINARHRPCDIESVIAQSLESCCAEIAGSVRTEHLDATEEVECDAALLQQALVNILRNAGEANRISGGDEIIIETSTTSLDQGDRNERAIAICVHDQGDGIPERVIERMFNPFFTTRAAGTGLGLAIVHRIVDAHRGRVEVGNHPNGPGA